MTAPETRVEVTPAPRQPRSAERGVLGGVPGGVIGGIVGGVSGGVRRSQQESEAETFPPEPGVARVLVGQDIAKAKLQYAPEPVYPPLARQARVQGTVRFRALLSPDGEVKRFFLVSGHPLLVPAAQEAFRQYRYEPTLLNGNRAEVVTDVSIDFVLP